MTSIKVYPGSVEVISEALKTFGEGRVITGAWDDPVTIDNLTIEEAAFAQKLFEDMGCRVVEES